MDWALVSRRRAAHSSNGLASTQGVDQRAPCASTYCVSHTVRRHGRGGDRQRGDSFAQDEDEFVVNPWHAACEIEHFEHHALFMTHSAEEVQERVRAPDVEVNAVVHVQQNPEALRTLQKAEIEKWWPIIKDGNIKVE